MYGSHKRSTLTVLKKKSSHPHQILAMGALSGRVLVISVQQVNGSWKGQVRATRGSQSEQKEFLFHLLVGIKGFYFNKSTEITLH